MKKEELSRLMMLSKNLISHLLNDWLWGDPFWILDIQSWMTESSYLGWYNYLGYGSHVPSPLLSYVYLYKDGKSCAFSFIKLCILI
jgi:hypothetical protein